MSLPPKLREWNLNTLLIGFGLMAALVGWGMTWADTRADIDRNSELIREMRTRLSEIDATNQRFANLDYRLNVEEKATEDINTTLRALETSISSVATDLRVMRSYLERSGAPSPD